MAVQFESAARLAALRDKADAVTGESSATLAGAVDALIAGFGAGGGGKVESANVYEITIGANSIANVYDANAYLVSLVKQPAYLLLNQKVSTNNQLVGFYYVNGNFYALRYRDGVFSHAPNQTAYDGKLIEGTTYTVFEYGV